MSRDAGTSASQDEKRRTMRESSGGGHHRGESVEQRSQKSLVKEAKAKNRWTGDGVRLPIGGL